MMILKLGPELQLARSCRETLKVVSTPSFPLKTYFWPSVDTETAVMVNENLSFVKMLSKVDQFENGAKMKSMFSLIFLTLHSCVTRSNNSPSAQRAGK